jgi:hypothetical protein
MGKVRWTGWTMAIATAFVISGGQSARADVASDKPAAIVVYPKIVVDSSNGVNTVIRLTNTNAQSGAFQHPVFAHCFYVNTNSHCKGATSSGQDPVCGVVGLRNIHCTGSPTGTCTPGWQEIDFDIVLTPGQPLEWDAADGLINSGPPLPTGHCATSGALCTSNADCAFPPSALPFCSISNFGTAVPPVTEDPFVGELRCIEMTDSTFAQPSTFNDLKGEALIETLPAGSGGSGSFAGNTFDVASYNAIGIQATGAAIDPTVPLTLGPGKDGEYNGCPGVLILNHFFDGAVDPVANAINGWTSDVPPRPITVDQVISTDLTLVPCTVNYAEQLCGTAVAQYLVFNEFEQRFSTSRTVNCWQEINLCQIDTTQCNRSIWSVGFAGTLTGQTRVTPIPVSPVPGLVLPTNGLLGVAIERHTNAPLTATAPFTGNGNVHSAAFNLHIAGSLANPDTITTFP